MPELPNPRHEAFARARANGARLKDAYEDAGYAPGNRHATRLATTQEVADRIAELRAERIDADAGGPGAVAALWRIFRAAEELKTAASIKEARITVLEAWRVALETARLREADRVDSGISHHIKVAESMLPFEDRGPDRALARRKAP